MKKDKYHIFLSWIFLFCFVAGQYMVYAHQHPVSFVIVKTNQIAKASANQPTFKEKCYLCDVMHNYAMLISYQVFLKPVPVIGYNFQVFIYRSVSARLIIIGGRAPPLV